MFHLCPVKEACVSFCSSANTTVSVWFCSVQSWLKIQLDPKTLRKDYFFTSLSTVWQLCVLGNQSASWWKCYLTTWQNMLQRPYKQGRGILWLNNTGGSRIERQRGLANIYIYLYISFRVMTTPMDSSCKVPTKALNSSWEMSFWIFKPLSRQIYTMNQSIIKTVEHISVSSWGNKGKKCTWLTSIFQCYINT